MTIIAPSLPQIGQLNSSEDPKVLGAIDAILDDYNGNITNANIASGAAIAESKINLVRPFVKASWTVSTSNPSGVQATLASVINSGFTIASNTITVVTGGTFLVGITGGMTFISTAAVRTWHAEVYLNGSDVDVNVNFATAVPTGTTGSINLNGSSILQLAAGNTLQVITGNSNPSSTVSSGTVWATRIGS